MAQSRGDLPSRRRALRRDRRPARRPAPLWSDLTILGIVGVMLVAALGAGGISVYRAFYSPSAFVTQYLTLLSEGRAADALRLPGVALDRAELDNGSFGTASDALLRRAALAPLTDVQVTGEHAEHDETAVTVRYKAGGHPGTSTFRVHQTGWIGVAPAWAFAESPLAVVSLTVRGSERFWVNGFELDRRQIAAQGTEDATADTGGGTGTDTGTGTGTGTDTDTDAMDPVPMLVFSPGLYSVSVKTAATTAPGIGVLADKPLADVPLDVQAKPTDAFVTVVQQRVNEFLTQCATQQVLQPTGCPFGWNEPNRVTEAPTWSMVTLPKVDLQPAGSGWQIPATPATAHIAVQVQSLFDGSIRDIDQDVPFQITGAIQFLPDGSASISITAPDPGLGHPQG